MTHWDVDLLPSHAASPYAHTLEDTLILVTYGCMFDTCKSNAFPAVRSDVASKMSSVPTYIPEIWLALADVPTSASSVGL